jgi:hypothetical protein
MRRDGAIPERITTGPPISEENAEQTIGRRFRINDRCWASGRWMGDGNLWEVMEGQVESGATGTMDVIHTAMSSMYAIRWDHTAEMRFGYTTLNQETFDDLIRRGVLEEVWPEKPVKALKGKKAIDKLFEGEWESVCCVLWKPDRVEMDLNTRRYFNRRIEHAIFIAQNIELLRGGKPNFFAGFDTVAEFWKDHDEHEAIPFIDPVTAKYERDVKKQGAKRKP